MLFGRVLLPTVILSLALAISGCRRRSSSPAPAAPSVPRAVDDDLEDEEGDEQEPAKPAPPTEIGRQQPRRANTINGRPKGPKAADFNRVVQSAYGKIHQCFLARLAVLKEKTPGIQVRIVVGNRGRVVRAEVVGGVADSQVRSCVLSVLRALKFPAFEGPAVSQVVPFSLVRMEPGSARRR